MWSFGAQVFNVHSFAQEQAKASAPIENMVLITE